ncbi:hypothetical protein DRO69_13240 [Candidatus Bathyarchaeota archaeon]|nr:MAG: hypothetical protein DRO69_13240 [Candidatus Bathyarchaeota archaeon]
MKEGLSNKASKRFSKSELIRIKIKAMRRKVWFRTLTRSERAQIDLTIRYVQKVRSLLLTKVLVSIVRKLKDVLESRVARAIREVGFSLAEKLSQIAKSWGNNSASRWVEDHGFTQYLTIMWMNAS